MPGPLPVVTIAPAVIAAAAAPAPDASASRRVHRRRRRPRPRLPPSRPGRSLGVAVSSRLRGAPTAATAAAVGGRRRQRGSGSRGPAAYRPGSGRGGGGAAARGAAAVVRRRAACVVPHRDDWCSPRVANCRSLLPRSSGSPGQPYRGRARDSRERDLGAGLTFPPTFGFSPRPTPPALFSPSCRLVEAAHLRAGGLGQSGRSSLSRQVAERFDHAGRYGKGGRNAGGRSSKVGKRVPDSGGPAGRVARKKMSVRPAIVRWTNERRSPLESSENHGLFEVSTTPQRGVRLGTGADALSVVENDRYV